MQSTPLSISLPLSISVPISPKLSPIHNTRHELRASRPLRAVRNFAHHGRTKNPNFPKKYYNNHDEDSLLQRQKDAENHFLKNKDLFKSVLSAYLSGKKSMYAWELIKDPKDQYYKDSHAMTALMRYIPQYSIALMPDKQLFRGTDIPESFLKQIEDKIKTGDTKDIAHNLMHGIGNQEKICSTATYQDVITGFATRLKAISAGNKPVHIIITNGSDKFGRGVTTDTNLIHQYTPDKDGVIKDTVDFHEHEVLMDPTNIYKITQLQKNPKYIAGNPDTHPEYFIHLNVSNKASSPIDSIKMIS